MPADVQTLATDKTALRQPYRQPHHGRGRRAHRQRRQLGRRQRAVLRAQRAGHHGPGRDQPLVHAGQAGRPQGAPGPQRLRPARGQRLGQAPPGLLLQPGQPDQETAATRSAASAWRATSPACSRPRPRTSTTSSTSYADARTAAGGHRVRHRHHRPAAPGGLHPRLHDHPLQPARRHRHQHLRHLGEEHLEPAGRPLQRRLVAEAQRPGLARPGDQAVVDQRRRHHQTARAPTPPAASSATTS